MYWVWLDCIERLDFVLLRSDAELSEVAEPFDQACVRVCGGILLRDCGSRMNV